MKMAVDEIVVRPGRREAEPGDVRELAESMETLGLLNPVTVSPNHVLIAGLHRLEAAQVAGMNCAKGNNVSCTMQPTRKSFLDNTAEKPGVGWS